MRDGRRQFATGEIIPFLDQHVYPEGGVAEVKRARRREKGAFLKSVLTANNGAVAQRATQMTKVPDAAEGVTGASRKRPPRVRRADTEPKQGITGAEEDAVEGEKPGRAWPYGPVCMGVPTRGREPGSRRRSGESGEGCSTGESKCSAVGGGGAGAGAAGAADCDPDRPYPLNGDGAVDPGIYSEDAATAAADAGNSPPVNETGEIAVGQDLGHPAEGAARKRSSGCPEKWRDRHPDGHQRPQPGGIGQAGNESGATATGQERVPRAATPSPVVTSSVRVLDMGVVRPSE